MITSVSSASGYGAFPYFASGSWLEIKGTNLADPADPRLTGINPGQWGSRDFNGVNAPTVLDGISASINGRPGYVYYLSPGQINVQAPDDIATGSVAITVTNCKATSSLFMFTKQGLAPGLLAPSNYSAGGKQYLVATFSSDGAYVLNTALGGLFGLNSRPAKPGDLIVAYGIGFGGVTPSISSGTIVQQSNGLTNPVTFAFGSVNAPLSYAGLAGGFVGLDEFYVTVPQGLADGDYQINVTQNGIRVPQTLYLTVQNASSAPLPKVQSVTLSASSVAGGGSVTGAVTLTSAAPAGGAIVALASSSGSAAVPASITVPGGAVSANFSITTSAVSASQTATITASYNGSSAQAALGVTPSTGSTLPQFTTISIRSTPSSTGLPLPSLGAFAIGVVGGPNGYYFGEVSGAVYSPIVDYFASWDSVTVNGTTLTFSGLRVSSSIMATAAGAADITSALLTVTLTPQVVSTSGTVTGSMTLVSTLATVSGSFTGTYTAQ